MKCRVKCRLCLSEKKVEVSDPPEWGIIYDWCEKCQDLMMDFFEQQFRVSTRPRLRYEKK